MLHWYDEYGDATDVAYSFTKVDSSTMKLAAHGVEYGQLSDNAFFETNFKLKTDKSKKTDAVTAAAYGSLKDTIEAEGFGWMIKDWKTTTDNGTEVKISWKWAADGHALKSALTMGDRTTVGLISLDADGFLTFAGRTDDRLCRRVPAAGACAAARLPIRADAGRACWWKNFWRWTA